VFPGFDAGWAGDFSEADLVLVAHESLVGAVVRRGASREDVVVVGPVPPVGYVPAKDRGALRAEVGVDHDGSLVLVPSAVLEEEGTEAILIQLALASPNVAFLFDVDSDPDVAEELRRVVPTHGLTAWMFADERDSVRFWQIADVVIARARGHEVARALGVGAPLVLLPPGRSDATAARAIEAAGIGRDADVLATLAVTIDAAVEPDALRDGRDAIAALSVGASAERLSEAVRGAWKRRSTTGRAAPPRGLPHGLEPLPASRERSPHRSSLPPADDDLEARIDRELAELKKRL